jgi:hypothetical protein
MSELAQLNLILGPENSFWDGDAQERYRLSIPDAILIETLEDGARFGWRVTNPDRTTYGSTDTFPSRREAKHALRNALRARRMELLD